MESNCIRFAEVNLTGVLPRTRRRHEKSRTGCEPCKRRRIKCDEQTPKCSSCTRKGLNCLRHEYSSSSPPETARTGISTERTLVTDNSSPSSKDDQAALNLSTPNIDMLQMELFSHFETDTRFTLVFGPDVWKKCMGIALKNKFMMHAIFMIAAAHLSSMNPEDQQMKTAELEHQAGASAGLRQNLAVTLDPSQIDTVFPVCILLFNQVWASIDNHAETSSELLSSVYDDSLIHIGAGFKGYVLGTGSQISKRRSVIFGPIVEYSPRVEIVTFIECAKLPEGARRPQAFEQEFSDEYFRIWPGTLEESGPNYAPYINECKRLTIILSALDMGIKGLDIRSLEGAIVRYLFTWSMIISPEFMDLVRKRAKCVLLLFWHYYSTVQISPAGKIWWARRRTDFMVKSLRRLLREVGIQPRNLLELRHRRA